MILIDLSHEIEDGLVTYRGLPAPAIREYMSREASRPHYSGGTTFQIGMIEMVANTGTYIDAPFHRFPGGADIAQLPLERLSAVKGLRIRVPPGIREIDETRLTGADVAEKAVLFETGWARHWKTERYFDGHPYLSESVAVALRDNGARIVGIDSFNIDDIRDGRRPVHTVLLAAGIPIIEHLCNLAALPDEGFAFFAVPPKVRGLGTFPVRAYAAVCATPGSER